MSTAADQHTTPQIDPWRCTGCGICEQRCPAHAVAVRDGVAVIVRPDACSFCEVCERFCPTGAIGRPFAIRFAPQPTTADMALEPTRQPSSMLRDGSTTI
ncbi:MAG TPA: 4Fe-4S binding protein [Herpetosiphonaceae bacterium]